MNELVSINGRAVERITYRETPVITLPMVDDLHERPKSTARQSFNRHKKRFIEGEDFFNVPQDEWKPLISVCNSYADQEKAATKFGGDMVFLTETGYLMLVKSFTDDLSWQIQRQLVKSYFAIKSIAVQQHGPLPIQTKVTVNTGDLVRESNKGNRFAQRLLHHLTGMQVDDIAAEIEHRMVVEDFRRAQLAAEYFDLLLETPEKMGITEGTNDEGHPYLQGTTTQFFNVFKVLGKAKQLPMLAKEAHTLGTVLSKESSGLEFYGWQRSVGRVLRGVKYFRFEKIGGKS